MIHSLSLSLREVQLAAALTRLTCPSAILAPAPLVENVVLAIRADEAQPSLCPPHRRLNGDGVCSSALATAVLSTSEGSLSIPSQSTFHDHTSTPLSSSCSPSDLLATYSASALLHSPSPPMLPAILVVAVIFVLIQFHS